MRLSTALLVAVAVVGCSSLDGPPRPSTRPLGSGEVWLPVVDTRGGQVLCAGGGTIGDFRLRGSATDPRLAWEVGPDGAITTLVWPPGTSARFTPGLEVLDPLGRVIARDGDRIIGGCSMPNGDLVEFEGSIPSG